MKIIGLTGGIGSGKTSLLPVFDEENIPIFNADHLAKELQNNELKDAILILKNGLNEYKKITKNE